MDQKVEPGKGIALKVSCTQLNARSECPSANFGDTAGNRHARNRSEPIGSIERHHGITFHWSNVPIHGGNVQ